MTQAILRDTRTVELGKTRICHLRKEGHPGYGRIKKSSLYQTTQQAEDEARAAKDRGFATLNDFRVWATAQVIYGPLPEVETEHRATSHLDEASEERAPLSTKVEAPAGDPPREEAPLPKRPWEDFWAAVKAIVGEGDAWKWLGEGEFPVVEYGQVIEIGVPNHIFKESILERELDQCVLRPALEKVGISKLPVIAIRPRAEEPATPAAPKKEPPKDPIIASLEEEMRAQKALDPRGSNEVVKGKLSDLWSQWFARKRELKPTKQWQNHIANWRLVSGKKGVSGFESTGPATKADLREAERALRKDSS